MQEPESKTGIVYCRVSSKEQVEGLSLETQERICREYAGRNAITVLRVFIDKGESAKTADRPEFQKAISFCAERKRQINYFIVYKLDRFSRNTYDHVAMTAKLRYVGTRLLSSTENIDDTPQGKFAETIFSGVAQFDNDVRAERTKAGMLEHVRQGIWVWGAPYGYFRPKPESNIAINEKTVPYTRLMFEEYAKGIHTYKSLADFLGERGMITTRGKKPFPQQIEKMLKNPVYYGLIRAFGEENMGTFEPIITKGLFDRCQEGYKAKSRPTHSRHNEDFPLRRLVLCNVCKKPFTGSFSRSRNHTRYPYYHHQHQGCVVSRHNIPKETFEQLFVEYLSEITPSKRYEKLFKEIVLDIWKTNYKKADEQTKRITSDIEALQQQRQEVFDLHRSHVYNDDEFLEQKNRLNQQIQEKNVLLMDAHTESFNMDEVLTYTFNAIRTITHNWLQESYERKLRFQKILFKEKPEFDGKKFGTAKLSLVYKLNQESLVEKSNLVPPTRFELVFLP